MTKLAPCNQHETPLGIFNQHEKPNVSEISALLNASLNSKAPLTLSCLMATPGNLPDDSDQLSDTINNDKRSVGNTHFYSAVLTLAVFTGHFTLGLQSNYLGHMEAIPGYKSEIGELGDFQLFLSLIQLGHACGCLFGLLNLYFGHRWIIAASLLLFLLLVGLEFLSAVHGTTLYCVCQIGQGFAAGLMNKTATFYLHDIAPRSFRKLYACASLAIGTVAVIVGKISSLALLDETDRFYSTERFRICLLYKCVAPTILLLLLAVVPESPFVMYREQGYQFGPRFDTTIKRLYPRSSPRERCLLINEIIRETQIQMDASTGALYSPVVTINNLGIVAWMSGLSSIIMCRIFCFRNADLFKSIGLEETFGSLIFSLAVLVGNLGGVALSLVPHRVTPITLGGVLALAACLVVAGVIAWYDQQLNHPCLITLYTYLVMGFLVAINATFVIDASGFFPNPNHSNRVAVSSLCSGISWFVTFLMSVFFTLVSTWVGIYSVWIILCCLGVSMGLIYAFGDTVQGGPPTRLLHGAQETPHKGESGGHPFELTSSDSCRFPLH